MVYLLDTNTVSRLLGRDPKVVSRCAGIGAGNQAVICTIVRGEMLWGIERLPRGRRREELWQLFVDLVKDLKSVPVPDSAAEHYSAVKQARKVAGRPILENDLWIVATSLAIGAILVSHDNDMQGIAGLTVEDWWQ
jgi:tRNA(fMet)-specific endonuclease VapC